MAKVEGNDGEIDVDDVADYAVVTDPIAPQPSQRALVRFGASTGVVRCRHLIQVIHDAPSYRLIHLL